MGRTYGADLLGVRQWFGERKAIGVLFTAVALLLAAASSEAAPQTFDQAKRELRQFVYFDQNQGGELGTLYCGCDWRWVGASGGRVDFDSCGYQIRAQRHRAIRTEWEHIVPASWFGRQRQCWQDGGRRNCVSTDPVFRAMEADMHNLSPSVGEINADRSNHRFGPLPAAAPQHGACDFRVDFRERVAEPRDLVKGLVARVMFYMHDRYDLSMSRQQQQVLIAWDRQFPVSLWELERDRRIAERMGHSNPFVTGERRWTLGHRNVGEGVRSELPADHPARAAPREEAQGGMIRGNRNSRVYHLPVGCPSYDAISPRNIVEFESEEEAMEAGYRKAGNCR